MKTGSYFHLLEIDQRYDLDQNLLKSKYIAKQKQYHPDRAVDEISKIKYMEISMQLNEAYKTLSDDCKRAEHLLNINGIELDDKTLSSKLSPKELEEILDEYEIIDEMTKLSDFELKEQQKLAEKADLIRELAFHFSKNNFSKALDLAVRLKYLTNLVGNIKLKIKHADSRD